MKPELKLELKPELKPPNCLGLFLKLFLLGALFRNEGCEENPGA